MARREYVRRLVAEFGGARRNRTDDILLAKQALSLLSYGPEFWCTRMGSNHRRARLQRAALPLSYLCEVKHSGKRVFELVKDTGYRTRASLPARPRGRGDPAFAQRMSVQFGKVWIPASAGMSGCGNSLTSLFAVVKIQRCKKYWSGRGESNSSSTRRQRATLPLSYGRGLLNGDWWAGMDSNHLRMNGAFTERWARQCPACPSWRRSEVLIPSGSRHPSRFERAPDSCPVTSPCLLLAEGRGLDPQCARHPIRFRRMPASRPVDLPYAA
jgi:hypothetical protein